MTETREGIIRVYQGGIPLDIDIFYNNNGTEIFLPKEKSYLGAVLLETGNSGFKQPQGIFVYNGQNIIFQ